MKSKSIPPRAFLFELKIAFYCLMKMIIDTSMTSTILKQTLDQLTLINLIQK